MFTVRKADQLEMDVRVQISRIFADGFSQWLGYFSKDEEQIARAFAHMFNLDHFMLPLPATKWLEWLHARMAPLYP